MNYLTGTMTCPSDRRDAVRAALPNHVDLTRAEPECLRFAVTETGPRVFAADETFDDRAAFDAHQARGAASAWAIVTAGLPRDCVVKKR